MLEYSSIIVFKKCEKVTVLLYGKLIFLIKKSTAWFFNSHFIRDFTIANIFIQR